MKQILSILMALFLLSGVYAIIYSPLPIVGKIDCANPEGLVVTATNLRTGISMNTQVDSSGYYMMEWANSYDNNGMIVKYLGGDNFRVDVSFCSDKPSCSKTIQYTNQPEVYAGFDLYSIITPTTTTTTTSTSTTTTTIPQCSPCDSCCPECQECPKMDYKWLIRKEAEIGRAHV